MFTITDLKKYDIIFYIQFEQEGSGHKNLIKGNWLLILTKTWRNERLFLWSSDWMMLCVAATA